MGDRKCSNAFSVPFFLKKKKSKKATMVLVLRIDELNCIVYEYKHEMK
jgi:hypothetical protein